MAGDISRKNGKSGGRPKGNNTLTAEIMRERIAAQLEPHVSKIVDMLIKKAEKGDIRAIRELFDRAYGRPISEPSSKNEFLPTACELTKEERAQISEIFRANSHGVETYALRR